MAAVPPDRAGHRCGGRAVPWLDAARPVRCRGCCRWPPVRRCGGGRLMLAGSGSAWLSR